MLRKRLLSGGAWALAGRALLALTGLALSALLGRVLSPQDLGVFFLAFSVVMLCAMLSWLGLEVTVVRLVAESFGLDRPGRARTAVRRVFVLGAVGASTMSIAYLLFGGTLAANLFDAPALATGAVLITGWILVLAFQNLMAETFRGFNDIRLASIFSRSGAGYGSLMAGVLLTSGLALLWLSKGRVDLTTVLILAVGSGLASVVLAGWLLVRKVGGLPIDEGSGEGVRYARILHITWPLHVHNLALFTLTQADIWIVGAFQPQAEVAIYGAAARLVAMVIIPLLIVNEVVAPLVAENYTRGERDELQQVLRTTATLAGIPAILALLSFTFFGGQILGIIFGAFYKEGAVVMVALSLGYLVAVWAGPSGVTLAMTGHQAAIMTITLFCGAIAIVTGLLVVNTYGAAGVAAAAAVGIALQNVSMWLGARFATGMWTHMGLGGFASMIRALRAGRKGRERE